MKRNPFIYLTALFLLVVVVVVVVVPKGELHLALQIPHSPFRDFFFSCYTHLGEWPAYLFCIGLLFYKAGWASFTAASLAVSGLLGQAVKHLVGAPRPLTWFAENMPDIQLQLVEGVKMNYFNSFPSGHTTSFFALFFALSIVICQTTWKPSIKYSLSVLCFLFAVLGAFSRVYLNQHFAMDILGGAFLGVMTTALLLPVASRLSSTRFWSWSPCAHA